MSPTLPFVNLVSDYAGGKARQIRRDALLLAFVGLMAVLASAALLAAFAAWVAQSLGIVLGFLAAAGLALLLAVSAMIVRSIIRNRAKRRQRQVLSSGATSLGVVTLSSMVARHKGAGLLAALALGALAAYASRSKDD